MESSPPRGTASALPTGGAKRQASLLPAFEPLTSSPSLPRPPKRVVREDHDDVSTYPTPVPTSSTHILSSSPPRLTLKRPRLQRTWSTASERTPLSTVPTVMLPESGETVLMGRSSASCHHQLSANRMISRVHIRAAYKPAGNPFDRSRVEITCVGWNGIKLHCQGKTYDLSKGRTFTSDIKDADVMIDIQDARVLVQWPRNERKDSTSADSDQTWDDSSPKSVIPSRRDAPISPLRARTLASPVSPSPAVQALGPHSSPLLVSSRPHNPVIVYEDNASPILEELADPLSHISQSSLGFQSALSSQHSGLSDPPLPDELSDHDEENDPIIHSFGPFGENLLPRMAAFRAGDSPVQPGRPARAQLASLHPASSPPQRSFCRTSSDGLEKKLGESKDDDKKTTAREQVQNHAINQLAFSRLSSTPLSTILSHLPPGLWKEEGAADHELTRQEVLTALQNTKCIGEIVRAGKDAAGKPLESEFHYIPDRDDDDMRRQAVVNDLKKPGLRNCRKQHKVRFLTEAPQSHCVHRELTLIFNSNTSGGNLNNLIFFFFFFLSL
jgi:hypothetical protein